MEHEEKILSDIERQEFFHQRLKEFSNGMSGCRLSLGYPVASRDESVRKAEEFFRTHSSDIQRGLAEHGDDERTIFTALDRMMEYGLSGNANDKEIILEGDDKVREKARRSVLAFMNNSRGIFSSYLLENYELDEAGLSKYWNVSESPTYSFCEKYYELAMREEDPELIAQSMLSLVHIFSPFCERAKKENESPFRNAIRPSKERQQQLNSLSLFSGNEEAIALYLKGLGKDSNGKSIFYSPECFYPSGADGRATYARKEYSVMSKKYLDGGFTEEELKKAEGLFQESVGDMIVNAFAKEYHLPGEKLLESWKVGQLREVVATNLSAIRDLEKKVPGAARSLFYGPEQIRCFERYDTDFLIEQMTPLEPGESYGVICSAHEDHNGAFRRRQDIHKKIREEATHLGMKTRIMEYSIHDAPETRLFNQLSQMADPAEGQELSQADFIWINQHGNTHYDKPEIIEQKRKDWEHIFGVGPNRSSLVIKAGGAVGSFMCFGGEFENVMNDLAEEYEITTTGASRPPSNIYVIHFNKDSTGSLSINIEYGWSSLKQGEMNIFKYDKTNKE